MAERSVRVRIDAETSAFNRKLAESAVVARGFADRLDEADGRMSNLVQSALALAPALVPIGAVGVPAVVALGTQAGFAALGVGSLVLAFQGVGDALTALDKFQLAPTADNLVKVQQAFSKLGPAAGEFVLYIDKLEPKLTQLRDVAAAGIFPGVEDGLNHMLHLLPQIRDIVSTTSHTVGDLIAEAGDNLDDPRWQSFFTYLDTQARPILTDLGHTAGNLVETTANIVQAFGGMTDDFSAGLVDMSRSLRDWSAGLADSNGFQDFAAYVEANGPRVLDTLGALADAVLQIVKAAAPVGSVVLPVLTEVLHVIAGIADSPIGPLLIGAAASIGVLGRSLALLKAVGLRGGSESVLGKALGVGEIGGLPAKYRAVATAQDELRAAQQRLTASATQARDAQFALVPTKDKRAAVRDYVKAQEQVLTTTEKVKAAEKARFAETAKTVGKAGALAAGFAVAQSGLADKTGLANTASLALMGSIAGLPGVIAGGAIGAVMDMAHANDDATQATQRLNDAFRQTPTDMNALQGALDSAKKSADDYRAGIDSWNLLNFKNDMNTITDLWTHTADEGDAAVQRQSLALGKMKTGLTQLHDLLDPSNAFGLSEPGTAFGMKQRNDELTQFANQIAPAAAQAGIDLKQALQTPQGRLQLLDAVKEYNKSLDTATGRSKAVGDALAKLGDQITPTTTAAQQLSTALDDLFGSQVSQSQAVDNWLSSLQQLRKTLKGTGDDIAGNSKAALANRDAIRSAVTTLEDRVKADAAAGASGGKIVATLTRGRDAILQTAEAAGKSREAVGKYLDTLGLTPKNLITIIETPGLLDTKQKVDALATVYGKTPRDIRTLISQIGANTSQDKIDKLAKKYDLARKDVRTLVKIVGDDEALRKIRAVQRALAALHDRNINLTVIRRQGTGAGSQRGQSRDSLYASGGSVRGPGTATSDSIPAWLSDGEYVVRAAAVARYGVAMMESINTMRFAAGGLATRSFQPAATNNYYSAGAGIDYGQLARALAAVRPLYGDVHLQPHDYNAFKREMLADRQRAGLGVSEP
jgi:hypothetical protein